MTVFRKIVPNSSENEINERYEHFLMWLSIDGGIRSHLFSHTKGSETETFKGFNIEGLTDIRSIPSENRISHKCTSRWMDSEKFDFVRSLMASNRVYKITKDNKQIPVAIKQSKIVRDNQVKNFEIKLEIILGEENTLNV